MPSGHSDTPMSPNDVPPPADTAGARLRAAAAAEVPLQVVGAVNAYCALLAVRAGFKALYLSGAGVANASFGLPDLGITTLDNVLEDARRITGATDAPLLVDIDTGFGGSFNIARAVKELARTGVAGMHIEDQTLAKRCGHRPNKSIVSTEEMVERIKAAVDARSDRSFVIMARTDALSNEGLAHTIDRAHAYRDAGADMIFPEAMTTLAEYRAFVAAARIPVLANITEFGQTPLLSLESLRDAGVSLVLYPLSAFRAMSRAAENVYAAIRQDGTQSAVLSLMQTREELYECLGYDAYEQAADRAKVHS
jgi:methylisocitrate lyase